LYLRNIGKALIATIRSSDIESQRPTKAGLA